jgi:ABC-type multidrug transport system fused ATPase/permease subunit
VAISLSGVGIAVLKPLPVKVIIDNVITKNKFQGIYLQIAEYLGISNEDQVIWSSLIMLLLITLSSSLIGYYSTTLTAKLGTQLLYDLSVDFYAKLQRLSLKFYSTQELGDLLQRFSGDAFVGYLLVAQITLPVITSLFTFIAMFYVMASIDVTLAIVAISVIPIMGLFLLLMSPRLKETSKAQFKKQGELSAFVMQSLGSMKMIQAFVREEFMHNKLVERAIAYRGAYIRATKVSEVYNQAAVLLTGIASLVLVGLGAFKGLNGELTAGELYVFLGYLGALYGPVNSLSRAFASSITFGTRSKRIVEVLDSDEYVKEIENPEPLVNVKGEIEFENVQFQYSDNDPLILKNINLRIEAGSTIAIIGPTGAGKTTIISLLNRFYDPTAGVIRIDGKDLRDVKLHSIRQTISLVLQEPFLFPMTIRENVSFGNPIASEEEIIEACKLAEAHDFIMKLKNGYDSHVAEAGTSLSGGEKQRICLARAFLKKAPIIILDEPTSALDALTESRIFKRLTSETRNKTVILISHRLSTIRHADVILTVDNGQIIEVGTHNELLKANGLYASLYSHQDIGIDKEEI